MDDPVPASVPLGIAGMSVDALAYELANKAFRIPVMEHVRTRLREGLDGSLDEAIELLFRKEWSAICASIDTAKAKGFVRDHIDNLDRLSVNHFYVLFERYFDILVPVEALPAGDAARQTRKKLFVWLEQIKDLRNPNSHPTTGDMSVFDGLVLADSCIRVVELLRLDSCLPELMALQAEFLRRAAGSETDLSQPSAILNRLPPREEMYDDFVGRSRELERLWAWFADDDSRRWVLVGEGGKGKSSIAHQFGLSICRANPPGYATVIWLSAKLRRFDDSSIVPVSRPDFFDLESALDRLLSDFGDSENSGKTVEAKRVAVLELLDDFPSLVIVDDIDSIDESNEEVVEFFTYDAPRTKSKILLTSRRMYPGMSRSSTKVSGLPEDDARVYIRKTAERLGILGRTDLDASFERIFEATEGSPLYIEDLLRLCRQLKVREAVDRWKQQRGDVARRYALQREVELLSNSARNCLFATCWARLPLSIAQMEAILGIGEDEIVSAVRELESRFLVPAPEIVEGVPSYRAQRNLEVLVRQEMRADPKTLLLRNAVESSVKGTTGDGAVDEIFRQATVRVRGGRAAQALELVEKALKAKPSSPEILALRAEVLAAQRPSRMTDARQDWDRSFELGLRGREFFLRWAACEERAEDWVRMYNVALKGLGRMSADDAELLRLAGYAASRIGQSSLKGLDSESGNSWLERAEGHLRMALAEAKRSGASDYNQSRIYRALIVNSNFMPSSRRDGQICYWTLRWLEEQGSADAIQEARRQAVKFSAVRNKLIEIGIDWQLS